MKRALFALVLATGIFIVPGATLYAANESGFDAAVDFSMNIRDIDTLVSQNQARKIDPNKYLVLNGSVASIDIVQPDEKNFVALVELVQGGWTGTEKVSLYQVFIVFSGPEFYKRIPSQPPQNPGPDIIQKNSQLLVIGRFADVGQLPDGKNVAVISGLHARSLQ